MNINLTRAVRYAFEDPRWQRKLGLLTLIGLIPGLNVIAWIGYQQSIAHNISLSLAKPLPAWDDWADIFVRGFVTIIAGFVYFSPLIVIGCCIGVVGLLGGGQSVLLLARCAALLIVIGYGSVAWLLFSVGQARYARSDQYSDYYQVLARLRELNAQMNLYLNGFLYLAVFTLFAALAGSLSVITLIGPFLALTALSVVNGYILGQVARQVKR